MDYKGRDVCLAVISDVTELVALRDQLARELADMNRLHELCRRLLEGGDTESRLKDVLLASMKLVGAQKGNVQLLDEAANALSIRAHVGLGLEYLEHFRAVPAGHGSVCGQALERRERIVAENVFEEGRFGLLREPFRREGLSACISTPLLGRDGVPFGMLSVLFAQPHKPREYELRLLDLYVHQAERVLEFLEAT